MTYEVTLYPGRARTYSEMVEWCNEHTEGSSDSFGGDVAYFWSLIDRYVMAPTDVEPQRPSATFYFESDAEAVMFKLMHSEYL